MMQDAPVAVIGAGIAGLTAALALARNGIAVDVLERAGHLGEVGAGLQLSPNATRILDALGLHQALSDAWTEPASICLADGRSLRRLATVPAGAFARDRWQAPYAVIARAALQGVLSDAVRAHPLCRLHFGTVLAAFEPDDVAAVTGRIPRLIVGADGVRSAVRQTIAGHGGARFSGNIAWRLTIAPAASPFDPRLVTAHLGRNAHLVAYPLGQGPGINLVAIGGGFTDRDADRTAIRTRLEPLFSGWHRDLRAALDTAASLGVWPLYEVTDGNWHDGARILIGDAAHAMMPFAAQGAAMAIEDGFELATTVARSADTAAALTGYVARRKARVAKVRARGAFNRFAYHAAGPVRAARDLVLSLRNPQSLAADFDWLYGYYSPV